MTSHPASPLSVRQLDRRQFVGVGLGAVGALAAQDSQPAPRRLSVGFLGVGYSHFAAKYRLLSDSPDFQVVGLCEDNADIRARGPAGARWLSRPELLAEAEVVVVESEVEHHARDARDALLAGRHVHVEKPPADSLGAFEELVRLAQERQRLLQVGYMWRYHPGINAALKAAREGWLGDVLLVRAMINTQGNSDQRREWARFRGGILFELGCHLIDPMVRLLGKPQNVSSRLQRLRAPEDPLADNTVALFEFPKGLGVVSSAAGQEGAGNHRSFEIIGTRGVARAAPLEPPSLTFDLIQPAGPYPQGRYQAPLPPYQRYADEFVALAQAIRSGRSLPVTAAEELNVQSALMQACQM